MPKQYQTEGRRKLLSFLLSHPDTQFTVDQLHLAMTQSEGQGDASVAGGKSSLYRQLSKLCDEGCVRKYRADNQSSFVYQYIGSRDCCHHFHLKCVVCGQLTHLDCHLSDELLSHIADQHGFRIDSGRSILYGLCCACEQTTTAHGQPI